MPHAMRVYEYGGADKLRWEQVQVSAPGEGQVLVRNTAVGLNFVDTYQRSGLYQMPLPFTPGSEGAGVVEAVCGLLIMVGLLTKLAAFLASGEMAVAFWYIHVSIVAMGDKGPGLPMGLLPIMNGGERAALFCFAFLYIATHGPGIWSVDASMGQAKGRT